MGTVLLVLSQLNVYNRFVDPAGENDGSGVMERTYAHLNFYAVKFNFVFNVQSFLLSQSQCINYVGVWI